MPILLLAAAAAAAPAPAPSPTPSLRPLKVIIHLHSTALCTNLHEVLVPFVQVEQANNIRFVSMDKQLGQYHQWYRPPGDSATDANGDPEYNGGQALAAANIDHTAAEMYADIARIQKLLKASEHKTPPGKDPQLDALRARAKAIVAVQQDLANRYEAQAGTYLNSIGSIVPMATAKSKGDPALQSAFDLPALDPDPLAAARVQNVASGLETPPPGSQYGAVDPSEPPATVVVQNMVVEENAFAHPLVDAVRQCTGQ